MPIRIRRPKPPPTGTVQVLSLPWASQSAVMTGEVVHVPAFREVVVHERLHGHQFNVLATFIASERPQIVGKRADHPLARHGQHDRARPGAPLLRAELLAIGGARELEDRPRAPDQLGGRRGRQVSLELDVGETPGVAAVDQVGLADHRDDRPRDQVQPVGDLDRHHRLDVEHVLGAAGLGRILGAIAEVQVVLERQADQVRDRVLRLLGELQRAVARGRRRGRGWGRGGRLLGEHHPGRPSRSAAISSPVARSMRWCTVVRSLPTALVMIGQSRGRPCRPPGSARNLALRLEVHDHPRVVLANLWRPCPLSRQLQADQDPGAGAPIEGPASITQTLVSGSADRDDQHTAGGAADDEDAGVHG